MARRPLKAKVLAKVNNSLHAILEPEV